MTGYIFGGQALKTLIFIADWLNRCGLSLGHSRGLAATRDMSRVSAAWEKFEPANSILQT